MLRDASREPVSSTDQQGRHSDDIYEDLCALRRRSALFKVVMQGTADDVIEMQILKEIASVLVHDMLECLKLAL